MRAKTEKTNQMYKGKINYVCAVVMALLLCGLLPGCSINAESKPKADMQPIPESAAVPPLSSTQAVASAPKSHVPSDPMTPIPISSQEDLKAVLKQTMEAFHPTLVVDASTFDIGDEPENLARNLYYELLGELPALKYTYDIAPTYNVAQQTMRFTFSYMPYKTASQPQNESLAQIYTLNDLILAAKHGIGQESVGIYLQNPDLDVDTMSLALGQVGGGYIICALNQDATEILFRPTNGRTMAECLDYFAQTDILADTVISEQCTPNMSLAEQLNAVYSYLTTHVRYDQRYYADPENMPYESTTAYGAFKDGMAICGGYAQALQILCEKIGLDCYTVSGEASGEHHMWNMIRIDGQWKFYDPTYDRGHVQFGYRWFGVDEDALAEGRSWNEAFMNELIAA